ncbi:Peptidyl-prolyl cis-trans isomerase CWC27 like protein [Eufriesea mexicana]|uniref:Spliceosome-associated protein CWC27 homolog n=1 Tax=Eufriesea mexicana TaxID=516756 RepID=A0A310SC21_9HYME|nr:Peptidyl-prolyl cis-trans isomerase CWC27 like protein [Eufriesea mexicana]
MKTTVGDIELELLAKETAKAYRNFIQLCMERYWDDTIFHGIIKGFITQDGDPTGTGEGGKIYGEPFKNKHTIFGEATGESIYSMLKLKEVLVDENDKPLYPPRLIKPIILKNPFFDIIPRIIGTGKSFNLLSFSKEAEGDEKEYVILNKKFSGKGKSNLDHLTDPKAMKERIKNTLRDTEKEPKRVQNYKIDDVEDDKGIKENE